MLKTFLAKLCVYLFFHFSCFSYVTMLEKTCAKEIIPSFFVLTLLSVLVVKGAREASFRNIKTIAECLADELINAAKESPNSYAFKKKDELERVAVSNR